MQAIDFFLCEGALMHSKKSLQLNISITPEQAEFLEQAGRAHCIPGPAMVRGLIDAAAAFHGKNGWFSFPVSVTPVMFQEKDVAGRVSHSKIKMASGIRGKSKMG